MANNITNKQIFDLIKMGVQVENGMKSSDVLSLETLENMSTMLMYFRKFLLINVDQEGDLDLRLTIAQDIFSKPSTSEEEKVKISNELRFEFYLELKTSGINI